MRKCFGLERPALEGCRRQSLSIGVCRGEEVGYQPCGIERIAGFWILPLLMHCRVCRWDAPAYGNLRSRENLVTVAKFRDRAFEICSDNLQKSSPFLTTTSGDFHDRDNQSIDSPRPIAIAEYPHYRSARSYSSPMASTGVNVRLVSAHRAAHLQWFTGLLQKPRNLFLEVVANLCSYTGPPVLGSRCRYLLWILPPSETLSVCKGGCDQ